MIKAVSWVVGDGECHYIVNEQPELCQGRECCVVRTCHTRQCSSSSDGYVSWREAICSDRQTDRQIEQLLALVYERRAVVVGVSVRQ